MWGSFGGGGTVVVKTRATWRSDDDVDMKVAVILVVAVEFRMRGQYERPDIWLQ